MSIVIYEITATVREDLVGDFETFLTGTHIPDLIATGQFVASTFMRSGTGRYRISYEAQSREVLDIYLREHASRLRIHMNETFPSGVELSREEWTVVKRFHNPE
jgi:hypothetical protein